MSSEYPFVLGTAGHIDHGKTSLVRALTGVDCDRLIEEKKRGITIELGFAPLELGAHVVSIVDVPGHEKFIRQMVAGASGVDAVMLVVAADEGVMPQTREHLDILGLLGVRDGLVAITKTDMVDSDMLSLVTEDVCSFVTGTFLEGRAICPVSSVSKKGLSEITKEIETLLHRAAHRDRSGAFFMPIDRAFPISGFGTVVTGTSYAGNLKCGDSVDVLPRMNRSRVRSIQLHGQSVSEAAAGHRVAINLPDVSIGSLARGDVICLAGAYAPTSCIEVHLRMLPPSPEPISHWQRVRLHIGTSDVLARVSLLYGTKIPPGGHACVQLVTEEPIAAVWDEHFIIRFYSPLLTIGGGRVLYASGEKPKGRAARNSRHDFLADMDNAQTLRERIHAYLANARTAPVQQMGLHLQTDPKALWQEIARMGGVITAGTYAVSKEAHEQGARQLTELLSDFHKSHPERLGVPADDCAHLMPQLDQKAFRAWMGILAGKTIKLEDGRASLPDFEPQSEDESRKVLESLISRGYELMEIEEFKKAHGQSNAQKMLNSLIERGQCRVVGGVFLLPRAVEHAFWTLLSQMEGDITIGSVRDATGTTRKYALPLLEHFDANGITRRVQDRRVLMKKPSA